MTVENIPMKGKNIDWKKAWPKVKAILDAGNGAHDVEREMGIKASRVYGQCKRVGYKIRRTNKNKSKTDEHDICLMLQLRYHGLNIGEIAEKFDIPYTEASRFTSKAFRLLKDRLNGVPVEVIASKYGYYDGFVKRLTDKAYAEIKNTN